MFFIFPENSKAHQIAFMEVRQGLILLEETKKILIWIIEGYKYFQIFYSKPEKKLTVTTSPTIFLWAVVIDLYPILFLSLPSGDGLKLWIIDQLSNFLALTCQCSNFSTTILAIYWRVQVTIRINGFDFYCVFHSDW